MKEIEILVEVKEEKEKVLNVLEKFNFIHEKRLLDIYFVDPLRENLKPEETTFRLRESFRLRMYGQDAKLTYKYDNFDENDVWIYSDEHEIGVSDFESALKLITKIGFEPLVEIENTKRKYLTDEYEIVFEEVKDLGVFLEVEVLKVDEKKAVEDIKEEIRMFLNELGLKTSDELNSGKPELMIKKMRNLF